MHAGRPVTFCKEHTVYVDSYSLNRVVNLNEGEPFKYLFTNNIAKQGIRMIVKYTSRLPYIRFIEIIAHLLFYPFVSVITNTTKTRYNYVVLNRQRNKIPIKYNLTNEELIKANNIRTTLRSYL